MQYYLPGGSQAEDYLGRAVEAPQASRVPKTPQGLLMMLVRDDNKTIVSQSI